MNDASGGHYRNSKMETWDAINDIWGLSGLASSVLRYVTRYRHKGNAVIDLEKAVTYIDKMLDIIDDDPEEELGVDTVEILEGLIGEKGIQSMAIIYITKFQFDGDPSADLLECRKACERLLEIVSAERIETTDVSSNNPHWPYEVTTSQGVVQRRKA